MKFLKLPKTVQASIIFITLVVLAGASLFPQIVLPLLIIAGSVGSLMRIFIYLVENR